MVRTLIAAVLVAFLVSCASFTYQAEFKGRYVSPTGTYTLLKATPLALRNVWDKRMPMYQGLPVEAFVDWDMKEIWYTTEESLEAEKKTVQSYRELRWKCFWDETICNYEELRRWLNQRR